MSAKVVCCQHRIQFCHAELISVHQSHFNRQKWFVFFCQYTLYNPILFIRVQFWRQKSFLSTKVIIRGSAWENLFLSRKVKNRIHLFVPFTIHYPEIVTKCVIILVTEPIMMGNKKWGGGICTELTVSPNIIKWSEIRRTFDRLFFV